MRRRLVSLSPCLLICLSLLFTTVGCNVVGALAAKMAPPPMVPAQFEPAKVPTLVLVENFHNPGSLRLESEAVARVLSEDLRAHEVAARIVDPSGAEDLRQRKGAAYRKMPLDEIGRALGAEQVIYVDLSRFDVERAPASALYEGKAEASVRVVGGDGEVLWPLDAAAGYPLAVRVEPQRDAPALGDQPTRQRLHAELAQQVGRLFYAWQSEGSDSAEQNFQE